MQTQPNWGDAGPDSYRLPSSAPPASPPEQVPFSYSARPRTCCTPTRAPRPYGLPSPLLSDGYRQGLSSDREPRLHQGGLQALRGCGLPADSTTPPPAAYRPPASPRRRGRAPAPLGAGSLGALEPGNPGASRGAEEPGGESLIRERAAPTAPARLPGRRRFRPLRPTWETAARYPKDLGTP